MKNKALGLIALCLVAVSAHASTWNTFTTVGDKAVYFFDADTLTKTGNQVALWIKQVNDIKRPDSDGSFSTTSRFEIDCSKRTVRILASSIYDKERSLIRTFTAPTQAQEATPDSMGEFFLKTACNQNFPQPNEKLYFRVSDNDVYRHTADYYAYQEMRKNDPAPK
jgi:hypothetical protein